MSGVDLNGDQLSQRRGRRGPRIRRRQRCLKPCENDVENISAPGGTPLVVANHEKVLGMIHLKDIVKGGLPDRFERFRAMGIKTVMITGDNPLTAAAIAEGGRRR